MAEQRYFLAVAWQAGRDPAIQRGADGRRDFATAESIERAAWRFMKSRDLGLMHQDGTLGHVELVESYIYRGPDWAQDDGTVIKAGDWLIGGIALDDQTWRDMKAGRYTGVSVQGAGKRRTPGSDA